MELKTRSGIAAVFLVLLLALPVCVAVLAMYNNRQSYGAEQFEDWLYRVYLPLEETAGVDRVLEPFDYHMTFDDGQCLNASKEIRVTTINDTEIPSQVYNITTYDSGYAKSCNVVFQANCTAYSVAEYFIYYGNPAATEPTYPTDLSCEVIDENITVENSYYKVGFLKDPLWLAPPSWISYLSYKPYDPEKNLLKFEEQWERFLMLITNIGTAWNVPWTPIPGTNTTVVQHGPVFIDVVSELGEWLGSGVNKAVKNFRFYTWIPCFTYSLSLNLTGATFNHIMVSNYLSTSTLPYARYRAADGPLLWTGITSDVVKDFLDWQPSWIDAENTLEPTNPVGVGFIMMNGTQPSWSGWRNGGAGEVAPFVNGALLEAHLKLKVLLHEGNCTVAEQLYIASTNPIPEFPSAIILPLLLIITLIAVIAAKRMLVPRIMRKERTKHI